MIYQPPQRERRSRGRVNPGREVALVLVVVALILAALLPIAWPEVPRPAAPVVGQQAAVPPTPGAMPQPYASASPTGFLADGTLLPSPATGQDFAAPEPLLATATQWFGADVPTLVPTYSWPTATESLVGYPGLPAVPSPSPEVRPIATWTPTADADASPTATAATGTVTATASSATPTETPDESGYP